VLDCWFLKITKKGFSFFWWLPCEYINCDSPGEAVRKIGQWDNVSIWKFDKSWTVTCEP
jgi:hypothetical protein